MEEHNQARRFTNLVDAVYDRNAKLVLVSDESDVRIDTLLDGVTKLQDVTESARTGSGYLKYLISAPGTCSCIEKC